MKLPEYYLSKTIEFDKDTFPLGTLIQPIWNESYVPEHYRDALKSARMSDLYTDQYVMCIIGKKWYPIPKSYIKENR